MSSELPPSSPSLDRIANRPRITARILSRIAVLLLPGPILAAVLLAASARGGAVMSWPRPVTTPANGCSTFTRRPLTGFRTRIHRLVGSNHRYAVDMIGRWAWLRRWACRMSAAIGIPETAFRVVRGRLGCTRTRVRCTCTRCLGVRYVLVRCDVVNPAAIDCGIAVGGRISITGHTVDELVKCQYLR